MYESFPFGGSREDEFVTSELQAFLEIQGLEVHILSLFPVGDLTRLTGLTVITHLPPKLRPWDFILGIGILWGCSNALFSSDGFRVDTFGYLIRWYLRALKMKAYLNQSGNYDIIYTFWTSGETFIASKIRPSTKLITRCHGYDYMWERYPQPAQLEIMSKVHKVVVPSSFAKNYLIAKGVNESQIEIRYLGSCRKANIQSQSKSKGLVPSITTISTNNYLKGIDRIADSLRKFPASQKVTWEHFGPEMRPDQLPANITLINHGLLPHSLLINSLYESKSIYVAASRFEGGLPVALLECALASKPIVATSKSGFSEFSQYGDIGRELSENFQSQEFLNSILEVWNNFEALAENAKFIAEEYFDSVKLARFFVSELTKPDSAD